MKQVYRMRWNQIRAVMPFEKKMRIRIISAALACLLVLMGCEPAFAATARATTMKLEKTTGTVTLKTQNGTARKITDGMRLYNGNTLQTGADSYAYVSLDSSKAVKMDENSQATLRQNGKDLELLVKSGKLFFDVSVPLTSRENMNIRTSTMVTGIRGTCGVVEYVSPTVAKLYLLEGKVALNDGEKTVMVYGGQVATVELKSESQIPGTPTDTEKKIVTVETLTEEEIPVVAIVEVASDPDLQKKIGDTTELDTDKIEEIYKDLMKQQTEGDSASGNEGESGSAADQTGSGDAASGSGDAASGSGAGDGGTTSDTAPETPADPVAPTTTLTGTIDSTMLQEALNANTTVTIASPCVLSLDAAKTFQIPSGKTLVIAADADINSLSRAADTTDVVPDIQIAAGAKMQIEGAWICDKNITVGDSGGTGSLEIGKTGWLQAEKIVLGSGSDGKAALTNNGKIDIGAMISRGGNTVTNNALIAINRAYTYDMAVTQKDTYSGGTKGVLFSGENSESSDTSELSSVVMESETPLASVIVATDKNIYCYANYLNEWCAYYLNQMAQTGAVNVYFSKDAVVQSNVTLNQNTKGTMSLYLDDYTIQIAQGGTLVLAADVNITSTSETATILLEGGTLELGVDGATSTNTKNVLKNTSVNGLVVKITKKSYMTWRDSNFSIDKDFPETSDSAIPTIPNNPNDAGATTLLIQKVMTGLTTTASSTLTDIPVQVDTTLLTLNTSGKTLNFSATGILLNLYG